MTPGPDPKFVPVTPALLLRTDEFVDPATPVPPATASPHTPESAGLSVTPCTPFDVKPGDVPAVAPLWAYRPSEPFPATPNSADADGVPAAALASVGPASFDFMSGDYDESLEETAVDALLSAAGDDLAAINWDCAWPDEPASLNGVLLTANGQEGAEARDRGTRPASRPSTSASTHELTIANPTRTLVTSQRSPAFGFRH